MSANPGFSGIPEAKHVASALESYSHRFPSDDAPSVHTNIRVIDSSPHHLTRRLSAWSRSFTKRLFDIACVTAAMPLALPALLITGLAVRITSKGPVLFRQQRMGCHGRPFTIYKFRTMPVRHNPADRPAVTTAVNQRFTPVGSFLRRWKLDELPQLFNVLRGDMSLVGPRPKLLEHQAAYLPCRPGITGWATIVFAREEVALSKVPSGHLNTYYHSVVLPLKQTLDDEYMARATFRSDLRLVLKSLFRNWDDVALTDLVAFEAQMKRSTPHIRMPLEWITKQHSAPMVIPTRPMALSEPWQQN